MLKVRQKTSGCFRTPTGAQTLTRIRSYLHTARKHSHNPLDALTALTTGHTWLPT